MMISSKQLIAALQGSESRTAALDRSEEVRSAQGMSEQHSRVVRTDDITLSSRAQEVMKARRALSNMPPVREEKIAEIKGRIEDGTYDVPAEEVAEKVISRAVVNRLFSDGGE